MNRTWKNRLGPLLALTALLLLVMASSTRAELTARGNLFVKFSGGIKPNALPRNTLAPISIDVAGTVRTLAGDRPPPLRQIVLQINRGGRVDTTGLPVCQRDQIEPSSTAEARALCGSALVGEGSYVASVSFPEQSSSLTHGRILAFNAVIDGERAVLAQVYGREPAPITRVMVFHIHETSGTYGTVLSATLPKSENRWEYLTKIKLHLYRKFTYLGQQRSYLNAACEAPPGFSGAVFPFAHAAMTFADGRKLSSTLTRSCHVR